MHAPNETIGAPLHYIFILRLLAAIILSDHWKLSQPESRHHKKVNIVRIFAIVTPFPQGAVRAVPGTPCCGIRFVKFIVYHFGTINLFL
jgi:hypothetical protein